MRSCNYSRRKLLQVLPLNSMWYVGHDFRASLAHEWNFVIDCKILALGISALAPFPSDFSTFGTIQVLRHLTIPTIMVESEDVESPRKKVKLSTQLDGLDDSIPSIAPASPIDAQIQKELDVGITSFVSPHAHAFSGILKKRYTDFLVNEILPSGEVLHLRSTRPPPQQVGGSDDTHAPAAQNGSGQSRTDPADGNSRNVLKLGAVPKSSNQVASEVEASEKTSDEVRF